MELVGELTMGGMSRFGNTHGCHASTLPVSNQMLEGWEETTVNVLINEESRTWNMQLIDGLFVPKEAELVKKIPLSRN